MLAEPYECAAVGKVLALEQLAFYEFHQLFPSRCVVLVLQNYGKALHSLVPYVIVALHCEGLQDWDNENVDFGHVEEMNRLFYILQ